MENKRIFFVLFWGSVFFLPLSLKAEALEQKIEDLSASVEVAPVFSISLDNPHLVFGLVGPGKTKILGEENFFNELKCRSNSGQTWYLKVQLVNLRLLEKREYSLPASNLKWRIVTSSACAEPKGRLEFQEFSEQPNLIYMSKDEDNRGKEVVLRFQYSMTSTYDIPPGNYVGQIIFTMAETP